MNQTKSIPLKTTAGVFQLTREQIISAMKEFDVRFRSTEGDSGTLYAVIEKREEIPAETNPGTRNWCSAKQVLWRQAFK